MPRLSRGWPSRCQPSRLHRVRQGARCEGATEPTVALWLGLWERTARTEILEQSTSTPRIVSADVADAIEALVGSARAAISAGCVRQERHRAEARRNSIADRCPLNPHKRRKSRYVLTAAEAILTEIDADRADGGWCGFV